MGTRRRFLRPSFAKPFITSSVWGLSQGRGPTLHEEGEVPAWWEELRCGLPWTARPACRDGSTPAGA